MNIIDTMNYSNKDLIESLFIQIENDLEQGDELENE